MYVRKIWRIRSFKISNDSTRVSIFLFRSVGKAVQLLKRPDCATKAFAFPNRSQRNSSFSIDSWLTLARVTTTY